MYVDGCMHLAAMDVVDCCMESECLFQCSSPGLQAYVSHALKEIFDVHKLDLQHVALSFGFSHPPKVDLNLRGLSAAKKRRTVDKKVNPE